MLYSIYDKNGNYREFVNEENIHNEIHLSHCLDHHSLTEIAWYIPYKSLEYDRLFSYIWNNNTGLNSRREKYENMIFNEEVKLGQDRLWKSYTNKLIKRENTNSSFQFSYTLDDTTRHDTTRRRRRRRPHQEVVGTIRVWLLILTLS